MVRRTRLYIFYLFCITGAIVGSYVLYTHQRRTKQCTVLVDVLCDPSLSHEIMTFAHAHANLYACQLSHLLCATYPHIAHVSCTYNPQERIVDVSIARPLINVNDIYFVCADKRVHAKKLFNSSLTGSIARVSIAENIEEHVHSSSFISWALRLSPSFVHTHNIVWRNPIEIAVQDPKKSDLQFIVDSSITLNSTMLASGYLSKEWASLHNAKNKSGWVVDMRFAQQIVLYPKYKGA